METVIAALIGGIGGGILSFVANLIVAKVNHKRTLERDNLNNESQLRRDEITWKRSEMMRIYGRFIEQATALKNTAISLRTDEKLEYKSLNSIVGSLPVYEVRLVASENVSGAMNKFLFKLTQQIHNQPKSIAERAMQLSRKDKFSLSDSLRELENAMRKDIDAQSAGLTAESSIPESELMEPKDDK